MPEAAYPKGSDLESRILTLGVLDPETGDAALTKLNLDRKARAAAAKWEERTGYRPFLAGDEATMRPFSPNGTEILFLNTGLLSVESLVINYDPEDPGAAETLVQDTDFYLAPYSAADEGKPYERIEFRRCLYGKPRSIRITGIWGFGSEISDDDWEAILDYGMYLCYPDLSLLISKGLYAVKSLNSEIRYAGGTDRPLLAESTTWKANFDAAADLRKLLTI